MSRIAPDERRRRQFERFADIECPHDPLYVALCRLLAARPEALALLDAAAPEQQRPNLLLAAIHERALDSAGGALASYFPSVGGERAPDAALPAALDALLRDEHEAIARHCATRATQTNDIGRSAVLWPALAELAGLSGNRPLALLDFGCSAGLNLGVDHYRYRIGDAWFGAASGPAVPQVHCHAVAGNAPTPDRAAPRIAARLGVDPAPVDLTDEASLRWLRACLWPHDGERRQRLDQAVVFARTQAWPVQQHADCFAAIEPWLDSLPPGLQPVVFNSWVLAYFAAAARDAHVAAMRDLVQRRGIAWLSAEASSLVLGTAPPAGDGDEQVDAAMLANASMWWLTLPGSTRLLARSHPHGRWLDWVR